MSNPLDVTGAAVENPELLPAAAARLAEATGVGVVALTLNVPMASRGQEWLYRNQARQWSELAEQCLAAPVGRVGSCPRIRAGLVAVSGVRLLTDRSRRARPEAHGGWCRPCPQGALTWYPPTCHVVPTTHRPSSTVGRDTIQRGHPETPDPTRTTTARPVQEAQ